MTDSLTTLISKVQGLLGDDGTRFPTATVTAALRNTLKTYNEVAPVHAGTLVSVVSGQQEYDLSDEPDCANLVNLLSVHKQATTGDRDNPISHDFYFEDNRPFLRLQDPETSGFLVVRFSIPNTIQGLDGATESTVPDFFDSVLVDGGCMHSCLIRIASRAEAIKLDRESIAYYERLAAAYRLAFNAGLKMAARRRAPSGEPDRNAWTLDTYGEY